MADNIETDDTYLVSLKRADGTRWNEAPKPGYNPLGKARDAN